MHLGKNIQNTQPSEEQEPQIDYRNPIYLRLDWPPEVKKFCYKGFPPDIRYHEDHSSGEYWRLTDFLEDCVGQWVIVYRRGPRWFSWVVVDEVGYTNLCRTFGFTESDFEVIERG